MLKRKKNSPRIREDSHFPSEREKHLSQARVKISPHEGKGREKLQVNFTRACMFLYLLNFPLGKNILRGIHAAYLSLRRRKRFKNLKTQISNVIKWTACCQARSGVHEPGMDTVM